MITRHYLILGVLLALFVWNLPCPSNDRDWIPEHQVLARAEFDGDQITIYNVKNYTYYSRNEYSIDYYDRTFDLNELDGAYFIYEPFMKWEGAAHTFVSFEFDGEFIAISVEVRKEEGESYSARRGLYKQYELMYIVGDERDLVKVRGTVREADVYIYPVVADIENVKMLFIQMLKRANALAEQPEFYHTLLKSCTSDLIYQVNEVVPGRVPLSYAWFLPGYSDRLAYESGLIPTDLPFEEVKQKYYATKRIQKYADDPDFSRKIRMTSENSENLN